MIELKTTFYMLTEVAEKFNPKAMAVDAATVFTNNGWIIVALIHPDQEKLYMDAVSAEGLTPLRLEVDDKSLTEDRQKVIIGE